ncbi:uncharacterized protein LOC135502967 [Lineus longissimus]|uniref:uncharacterized protein LOC135502967 n=1 Tax=Lineus longissimus TaxID=88925 RepID=UPI002B4E03AB
MIRLVVSFFLVLLTVITQSYGARIFIKRNAAARDCYDSLLKLERKITNPDQGPFSFSIPLKREGKYPEFIRVSVDEVYDGAYRVTAITPTGRILSEATFATKGEMVFDPRYTVSRVRVMYLHDVIALSPESLPRIKISVFGCY